ncbi:hypothetical protein BDB00DRAFT_790228 [Zychaea mexicana]|uniref:uncharacterized protein n=1 Tax=Zychaea mexicana TaxID=64656 RepID=UPI0022FDCC3B|nr:uncharacterized protein BDB00DRAFT_790228 [Zychaea mexicana]KAI9490598.1 hypothetical protein BDB00DRAFT_790228 [Zychaea mexicana]
MNKKLTVILLFLHYHALATTAAALDQGSNNACSWPCPNESDVCQLAKPGQMSCQPLHNRQWIIPYSQGQPVFYVKDQSSLSGLYQSCELAPSLSPSTLQPTSESNHNSNNHHYNNNDRDQALEPGTCAPGLSCIQGQCHRSSSTPPHYFERRENGNTFSTSSHHTTAFNVIHVIAAVVGILGAALVGVTVFVMCRRRRRKQAKKRHLSATKQQLQHTTSTSSSSSSASSSPSTTTPPSPTTHKSMHRFNQFAQAYEDNSNSEVGVAVPPHVHQSKTGYADQEFSSPSMQQMHLHTQLLYQAGVQRGNLHQHQHPQLQHHHQHSQHQQQSSSSALLPPPPPYQP